MADMKRFGALLVAAAACVGANALHAEQQHNAINITGEMQFDAAQRSGTTSFRRSESAFPGTADGAGTLANTTGLAHDESDLFVSRVYLNFGFDLSTNAKAFVQLGGTGLAGNNADNTNTGAGTNGGGDSSFVTRIRQAYVELNEVFMPQLGLKIGLQDQVRGLDRGDGNHFVMYSPGWGKHFQIRDGGRVERSFSSRARQQNVVANSSAGFDDLNNNTGGTFAYSMTWSQKDMFSAELFYVHLEEDGVGLNEAYLWGAEAKMPLKSMNDKSLFTAHIFNVKDNTFAQLPLTVANKPGTGANFWQYGFGADLFFQDAFELYGEAAWQTGAFADHFDLTNQAHTLGSNADLGQEKRQNAYAYYVGTKFMVPGAAEFRPSLDLSYWVFSGDDNQDDANNSGFINYGDNKSSLVVEDASYGIGLSNNYNAWRFKTSVDLDGIFKKGRKTPFGVSYHMFDVREDRVRGTLAPTSSNGGVVGDINPGAFGTELDFWLAHEYSENVTFKLGYGVFMPGMYIRENANLSPQTIGDVPQARGTVGLVAGDGSNATVMVFTTSVKF